MANQRQIVLVTLGACLAALVTANSAWAQDPNMPARSGGFFSFEPMVDTGVSELGGRRVSVHVPGLFDLKLDTRPNHQGARLSQTVMSGLVRINLDRTRQPDGRLTGPIDVRVMGIPIYRNEAARSGGLSQPSIQNPLANINLPAIEA